MSNHSVLDTYRFTTFGVPESERFAAWAMAMSVCDYELQSDATVAFDAEFHAIRFGPFVLTSHRWTQPEHTVSCRAIRSARKIRADGLDYYYLMFRLAGKTGAGSGRCRVQIGTGGLRLCDMSLPFDHAVTAGDAIGLLIRRDMLRSLDVGRDGSAVDSAMGAVLAEYLLILLRNMERLGADDIPYIVRATNALLWAGLTRSGDSPRDESPEGDVTLMRRARQFIEVNLLHADLAPGKIGDALGISRAKLYKLFQGSGGIMRQVRQQRLDRAYDVLTDPAAPKARVAEIAWRHGFVDEKYFSRMFRARFGLSPREAMEGRHTASLLSPGAGSQDGPSFLQWLNEEHAGYPDKHASDPQSPDQGAYSR
ncbi:helix-turn-helix domain-containing protein [Burkholderia lata]|uniref:AraC family transcriptional regulator n=1 Tax=Burkholderia lata (strain ATCC 17760 / DSM 23089 / LMG 22485 / NCIMB 9086 / R18194 / 383) TaxID=482957 RepID=A0A6P2TPU0_BURL3|nr:helix-turn-helix domain-containing protein [Burkholderia lata]VWC58539.1 AraC family transcriptional regulator [Burkholderia lata]